MKLFPLSSKYFNLKFKMKCSIYIDCISTFNFVSRVNNFLSHWKILEQIGSKIEFCNHLLSSPLPQTFIYKLDITLAKKIWIYNSVTTGMHDCRCTYIGPKKEIWNLKMDFCNHHFAAPLPPLQVRTCKDWLYNLLTSRGKLLWGKWEILNLENCCHLLTWSTNWIITSKSSNFDEIGKQLTKLRGQRDLRRQILEWSGDWRDMTGTLRERTNWIRSLSTQLILVLI